MGRKKNNKILNFLKKSTFSTRDRIVSINRANEWQKSPAFFFFPYLIFFFPVSLFWPQVYFALFAVQYIILYLSSLEGVLSKILRTAKLFRPNGTVDCSQGVHVAFLW